MVMSNIESRALLIDCMEFMRGCRDGEFDLAVVDPPYGIGADKPSRKPEWVRQKNGSMLHVDGGEYEWKDWDACVPGDEYFRELSRVSRNQIIWGANYFGLKGGMIVWDKLNGSSDQYGCEIAWQSFDSRTDIVRYMWSGMFQGEYCGVDLMRACRQQGNKALNEKRIHPTQNPVLLYAWLYDRYAKEGDRILDTHLGSGSSRIAAWKMGLDFVGCEVDSDYWEKQEKRFREECLGEKVCDNGVVIKEMSLF